MTRASKLALAAAVAASVPTAAIVAAPFVDLAYRAWELKAAFETAAALSAGLAGLLLFGRFQAGRDMRDVLLLTGLVIFAGSNLFFATIPAIAASTGSRFATWALAAGILVGAGAFAGSALAPRRRFPGAAPAAALALVPSAAVLALIAGAAALLAPQLPLAMDPHVSPAGGDLLTGNPPILVLHGVTMILFAVAAVGFARQADGSGDELTTWLAAGAVLAGAAALNYVLSPSLHSGWVCLGDALRLAAYLALLTGAVRDTRTYHARLAEEAMLNERRRMARELHDGLAQELAFISSHGRRLESGFDPRVVERVRVAADRALDESRGVISSLMTSGDEPFEAVIGQAAEEVARRYGANIDLDVDPSIELQPAAREAMRRIVREAVGNAVRHGKAPTVKVEATNHHWACRLRVVDNGTGFDHPEAAREAGSYGLVSMRQRAAAVGARLAVRSDPGEGTVVEVVLP